MLLLVGISGRGGWLPSRRAVVRSGDDRVAWRMLR